MLEDVAGIRRVMLACGRVDLRKGIDGLAMIIGDKYGQNPFEQGTWRLPFRHTRFPGKHWMLSMEQATGVRCPVRLIAVLLRLPCWHPF